MAILGERWNGKDNDLAKRLRLTKTFVSVGVGNLVSAGLLIRLSAVTERRGRPAISYEVSSEVQDSLTRLESPFSPLFDELFLGAERSPNVSPQNGEELWVGVGLVLRKLNLSALDRLLLAVLLDHANEVGLVVGVSRSDLKKMTGLNGDRVRNRLSTLEERNLVRFHAPGFASARFPGGKVKSSYVLDFQLLPHSQKLLRYEPFSLEGSQRSRAEGVLVKGKAGHISFEVSQEAMLGIWLLLHRFVSRVLSKRKPNAEIESAESACKLIASTLRADSPHKADGVDFESLCKDLAEWVVELANEYIANHSIEGMDEEGQIAILPYGKWTMCLVSWGPDQSMEGP
ncbi:MULTISPECIES: hypothetical protein [unclassified Pseudomonas]|uniref:hypothetical protein n=1 Tax=unclassified Pseudomonas TaxID=196821 RepID=UPI002449A29F|nr:MULTISPECIES: hypothetical protein [unclassified Pseudomonas]MDH0894609.1 hypothetical protein [Pseudomonas sp. GD03875]MDH1063096.1 hypothetical protein [Pseudomonas sp. GD03985]